MREAESLLAPFFGHQPQDFGIPPEPSRSDKDGKPIGFYVGVTPVEDQIERLEKVYAEWLIRPMSRLRLDFVHAPAEIFRAELYLMVRAYSQCANDLKARESQVRMVENNVPQIRKRQELRNFLLDHFPLEINRAEIQNTDLIDLIMGITIQLKQELDAMNADQQPTGNAAESANTALKVKP